MFKILDFFKKKLPEEKADNDSCEFDYEKSLGSVLNKRYDREDRAYHKLKEQYDNFDELSKEERYSLRLEEADKIRLEDEAEDLRKKGLLRRIKTLRTEGEIKDAVNSGQKVLKEEVKPSKQIEVTDLHIKDKKTGEIIVKPYNYHAIPRDYDRYEIVEKRTYYPYTFPSKVAAYVLPDDLEVDERVILEDLIEDIVGASHAWGTYRLDSAEAIWNGEKFVVDCKSYDVHITMG